jgi:hypothetical protein
MDSHRTIRQARGIGSPGHQTGGSNAAAEKGMNLVLHAGNSQVSPREATHHTR